MDSTPHILAVPLPLQGHMNPMMQLCKRLVSKGVRVTFITTASILQNQAAFESELIDIEAIPDSTLTPDEHSDFFANFFPSYRDAVSSGLPEIIRKHTNSAGFTLKAVVYDSVLPWMLELAHEHGLKGAVLFTQSCTVCSVYYHIHKGTFQIPDEDDGSEVSLPGMPVMTVKDLPSFVYDTSSYSSVLRALIDQFSTFENADWRLFNTFDMLEHEVLKWMANQYPILSIGPTVPSKYLDNRIPKDRDYGLNLFKPDAESCLKWLDTKANCSVIYISFGSLINLGVKQMDELAEGLIDSKCNFLWIVTDPKASGIPQSLMTYLPEKGLVVNWCPQLEVLSHRAIGCFITHCGWNSTLEALISGVPMVGIPQRGDQKTNAKLVADVWEIGVRAKSDIENRIVTREEIVGLVQDVMEGEKRRDIRAKALKLKDLAIQSVSEGGSSDKNIMNFVTQLVAL